MNNNVVNYSTRDGIAVQAQFEADPELKKQPAIIKKMISGVFDVLNNTLNAVYNALLLRTAYSRPALQDVLQLIDYQMSWKQTAIVNVTLTIDIAATLSSSYTIPKAQLIFGTVASVSKPQIRFEARADVTFPMSTTVTTVILYAQETKQPLTIAQSSGLSWQVVELGDLDILKETLSVVIGVDPYSQVDTFANSIITDKVYRIYYRSDGSSYLKFAGINSVTGFQYGYIAPQGMNIIANYAVGGGIASTVIAGEVTEYLGSDPYFISVTNPLGSTGSADEETIQNAKDIAPLRARETGYFINESTGISILKKITGVLDASIVNTSSPSQLAVNVYVLPVGGGNPSPSLKAEIETTLNLLSVLQQVVVTALDPIYIALAISFKIKLLSGYNLVDVSPFAKVATMLRTSELSKYVYQIFYSSGIDAAREQINALWFTIIGYSFISDDNKKLTVFFNFIPFLKFGEDLHPEDIITAVEGFVEGVDYVNMITPTTTITSGNGGLIQPVSISVIAI